ncbi:sulfuric ester hydrolase [Aureococcus anophagefferens]|nr:sulfuric ester hydrolase [Aureococcus anophagefferens]
MEAALLLLLGLAVAAASTCADEPLWVDGVATSCADAALDCGAWFCPTCPYAHACDRHCGYCGGCGVGEVEDCAGVCLAAEDCALADYGYATCDDWRGSGCCEAGGLVSDNGFAPRFDCAEFGCDGGDCESCEGEDTTVIGGAPRAPWCLLLTATVCPARDARAGARSALRRGDYERALARWANGTSLPVVLVENSGAHLGSLRGAQRGSCRSSQGGKRVIQRRFNVRRRHRRRGQGKGHAEARAIRRALDSGILDGCERGEGHGRYFLEGSTRR